MTETSLTPKRVNFARKHGNAQVICRTIFFLSEVARFIELYKLYNFL